MMEVNTKNKFIEMLYNELGVYIIPANEDNSILQDQTYITYHIISTDLPDQNLEIKVETIDDRQYRLRQKQFQETISFQVSSDNEEDAYNTIVRLKDLLDYEIKELFYTELDLVLLSTTPIQDTSLRVLGDKMYRFNTDLRLRSSRIMKQYVGKIESYKINYEQ